MPRYAAFLRGMNLGGRRITNVELVDHVRALGFGDVAAFLASGNLALSAESCDPEEVVRRLETGLAQRLDYEVPTFVRSEERLRLVAEREAFSPEELAPTKGKVQVAFLRSVPSDEGRAAVLDLATPEDRLASDGAELYWLPREGISTSELDWKAVERCVGPTTVRTRNTVVRMVAKFFA